jgi:hypothetical protein
MEEYRTAITVFIRLLGACDGFQVPALHSECGGDQVLVEPGSCASITNETFPGTGKNLASEGFSRTVQRGIRSSDAWLRNVASYVGFAGSGQQIIRKGPMCSSILALYFACLVYRKDYGVFVS